jgi:hypothetical protein
MSLDNPEEIDRRVAILRRFRELLVEQRRKFEKYMKVLDHEKADIESGDVERLVAHVEIEEAIVSEIYTFQKVIDPLEDLYRAAVPAASFDEGEVMGLKSSLFEMRNEVLRRNEDNRSLLRLKMDEMRLEIAAFRNPLASSRSVFASQGDGGLVNIEG